MDFKEISKLIKLIDESNLSEFKLRDGEFSLRIRTDKFKTSASGRETQFIPIPQAGSVPIDNASVLQSEPAAAQASDSAAQPPSENAPEEEKENLLEIKSPIVGTFYRSPAPDKPPYIKVGDTISEGDVVCIVEAMKLFNEIESEVTGKVVKVIVEDATPVEYDQVLFLVDPQG